MNGRDQRGIYTREGERSERWGVLGGRCFRATNHLGSYCSRLPPGGNSFLQSTGKKPGVAGLWAGEVWKRGVVHVAGLSSVSLPV